MRWRVWLVGTRHLSDQTVSCAVEPPEPILRRRFHAPNAPKPATTLPKSGSAAGTGTGEKDDCMFCSKPVNDPPPLRLMWAAWVMLNRFGSRNAAESLPRKACGLIVGV